ncbi:MAG: tetratricopeptide repeat protein [Leptospiraceae bacterium]|nr:tetratricopeptide repeat protein [Leptospiraceae bacterium]MCP5486191.1 tetratricopeptide repeat protein [Spirochaetales bacterium]
MKQRITLANVNRLGQTVRVLVVFLSLASAVAGFAFCSSAPRLSPEQSLARRLTNNPDDLPALRASADIALYREDFERAREFYVHAIELDATDADTWFNLGLAYEGLAAYEQAGNAYRQSLQLRPDDGLAHSRAGLALARQQNFQLARFHFERSRQLLPEHPDAHYNYAHIIADLGDTAGALQLFSDYIALKPDDTDAIVCLAVVSARAGERTRALELFQSACEKGDRDACDREGQLREGSER